ncbi:YceI family protein [Spongiimicrobium sp. 3-5]|uniref:YceI family protein n=1 Tax=Spongiimicrobium sp. 3-5 TaxID=3332596 RepID=UPI0039816189
MKHIYVAFFSLLIMGVTNAQDKYLTKEGYVSFFSHSIVEDIKADNNQVLSVVDSKTGKIAIQLLMRSFMFEKALMREHFNDNYVESDIYPKAKFSGSIENFDTLANLSSDIRIVGTLSLHGKENNIATDATITVEANKLILTGEFDVKVADYDIKIPALVKNNISKTIKVSFELHHTPYK